MSRNPVVKDVEKRKKEAATRGGLSKIRRSSIINGQQLTDIRLSGGGMIPLGSDVR
jgi:hypothetical protein